MCCPSRGRLTMVLPNNTLAGGGRHHGAPGRCAGGGGGHHARQLCDWRCVRAATGARVTCAFEDLTIRFHECPGTQARAALLASGWEVVQLPCSWLHFAAASRGPLQVRAAPCRRGAGAAAGGREHQLHGACFQANQPGVRANRH